MDNTSKSFREVLLGRSDLLVSNASVSGLGLEVRLQDLESPASCMMLLKVSLVTRDNL